LLIYAAGMDVVQPAKVPHRRRPNPCSCKGVGIGQQPRAAKALTLPLPRRLHARADGVCLVAKTGRRLPQAIARQLFILHPRHLDVDIDPVQFSSTVFPVLTRGKMGITMLGDQPRALEAGHRGQQHCYVEHQQHSQDDQQQVWAVDPVEELHHLVAEQQWHKL
jgi:hypothetical protein